MRRAHEKEKINWGRSLASLALVDIRERFSREILLSWKGPTNKATLEQLKERKWVSHVKSCTSRGSSGDRGPWGGEVAVVFKTKLMVTVTQMQCFLHDWHCSKGFIHYLSHPYFPAWLWVKKLRHKRFVLSFKIYFQLRKLWTSSPLESCMFQPRQACCLVLILGEQMALCPLWFQCVTTYKALSWSLNIGH